MKRSLTHLIVASAVVAAGACTAQPAPAPAPASETPPAAYAPVVTLNEIMVYVVDPHANELWDAAVKPPTTDAEWKDLNHAAVVLATAGNLTKAGGNGPKDQQWTQQPDWVKHSQTVADAGLAAIKAVNSRDSVALNKAGDELVLSCITCHREYKLDVPKIWTERQLPPEELKPR